MKQVLDITKAFADKGSTFMIDISIDNNIFKITNQNNKVELPKPQWRKTPSQIQRDFEIKHFFLKKGRQKWVS